MAETTKIAWTDSTWNPWLGCTRCSPGCMHCYAEADNKHRGRPCWGAGAPRLLLSEGYWSNLRQWNNKAAAGKRGKDGKRWLVFLGDECDIFDDEGLQEERERMWAEVKACQSLTFQVLTKRPQNFAKYLPADWGEGYPNVWLGVTVDDRKHGYPRVDILRQTNAVVRFLSCEPLLEGIPDINLTGIDWVIVGGESGHGSRPFDLAWARSLRDHFASENIAFFFKQVGSKPQEDSNPFPILNRAESGKRDIHGKSPLNFPADLQSRQWPDSPAQLQPITTQLARSLGMSMSDHPRAEKRHLAAVKAARTKARNKALMGAVVQISEADPHPVPEEELKAVLHWLMSIPRAGIDSDMATAAIASLRAIRRVNAGGAHA